MRKKIFIIILMFVLSFSIITIDSNANTLDEDNIIGTYSPYDITITTDTGPQQDMLLIRIIGSSTAFENLKGLTFVNLDELTMLDPVEFTSGSNFRSSIKGDDGTYTQFMTTYGEWSNFMYIDLSDRTFTDTISLYFHYTLTSGATNSQFVNLFMSNINIYINSDFDVASYYDLIYNQGYNQAQFDTAEDIFQNGFADYDLNYKDSYDVQYAINYVFSNGYNIFGLTNSNAYLYNLGFNAGELSNINGFTVLINAFFQTFQILTIELLPGITLGAIAFIPLMLGLITFAVGLATASFSGNQYSKGAKKGGRKK